MKDTNFNSLFRRAFFTQIITGWTLLIFASYLIGEIWIQNSIVSHIGLWAVGLVGIYLSTYWRYNFFRNNGTTHEDTQISSLIYHAVMETSPDSIAITDMLGNYIFANKQTAVIHGYDSPEEFLGNSAFSLFPFKEISKAVQSMSKTRADGILRNIEFNLLRKDGTTFPAEMSAALIKNKSGVPLAFIAVTRDVTERKRIADQLNDMNEKLRQQLTEIEKLQTILHEQAIQDPLTGLYNRRYMEEALKHEHARATRAGQTFSVVMVDMNDLKKINDGYGHIMGDEAIKQAGNLLKERIRAEDIACRYGGDEFLVILHNASSETARQCTQQWENRAKELSITSKNKKIPISFSIGIATYPTDSSHIEELILLADASLYAAKSKRSY